MGPSGLVPCTCIDAIQLEPAETVRHSVQDATRPGIGVAGSGIEASRERARRSCWMSYWRMMHVRWIWSVLTG